VVYRTSFALLLFFAIHAILVRAFMSFHWMFLIIKLLCLIAFLIGSFWFSNSFYDGYAEFARVASVVFLVMQVLVLVAWAWDVSDSVLGKIDSLEKGTTEEKSNKCEVGCYQSLLVIMTFIFLGCCIVLWALMFTWFGKSGCSLNQTLIALTIIAVVVLFAVSIYVEDGSIFVTSIVATYGTYLCYDGLQSKADSCNALAGERDTLSLWLGILITAAALSYAGFSVSSQTNQAFKETESNPSNAEKDLKAADKEDGTDGEDVGTSNYDDLEESTGKSNKVSESGDLSEADKRERRHNVIFHTCMAFASIYISMLYTNWATNSASSGTTSGRSNISLGVNIGAEWLSFILYLWTLVAPTLLSGRDFSSSKY